MGKTNGQPANGDTKLLYRKSNNTLNTFSRTCSGHTLALNKSNVLKLKNKLTKSNDYYKKGDKLIRDLSVETDICKLRRYCKSKLTEMSTKDNVASKSKFSTVNIDKIFDNKDTIPDKSACGDKNNKREVNINIHPRLSLNLTSVMLDDFRLMLSNWIEKHVLENQETKQKIDTIVDSLLHQSELNEELLSSSCTTYTLGKKASKGMKHTSTPNNSHCLLVESSSSNSACCKTNHKHSFYSIPNSQKNPNPVSTLSIPRYFHNKRFKSSNMSNNHNHKIRNINRNKILLSIKNPNNLEVYSSSINLLAISTKSLTKRCVNYKTLNYNTLNYFPNYSQKSTKTSFKSIKLNTIKSKHSIGIKTSLYSSISNVSNCYIQNDKITLTDENYLQQIRHQKTSLIEKTTEEHVFVQNHNPNSILNTNTTQNLQLSSIAICRQKKCVSSLKTSVAIKPVKIKYLKNRKNYLRKQKSMQNIRKEKKHLKTPEVKAKTVSKSKSCLGQYTMLQKLFDSFKENSNIKFDIQVHICSMINDEINCHKSDLLNENKYQKTCDSASQSKGVYEDNHGDILPLLNCNEKTNSYDKNINENPLDCESIIQSKEILEESLIQGNENSEEHTKIIPLLDCNISNTEYIFSKSISQKSVIPKVTNSSNASCRNSLLEYEIVQEISELRNVIKDLATTAEKYIKEQLSIRSKVTEVTNKHQNLIESDTNKGITVEPSNSCKSTQMSNQFTSKYFSGLKLQKIPRKRTNNEMFQIMMKRSASYNIIDSESILKVTDMTSVAEDESQFKDGYRIQNKFKLQKSKSLLEMAIQKNEQRVMTFFCDNSRNIRKCGNKNSSKKIVCCNRKKQGMMCNCQDDNDCVGYDSECSSKSNKNKQPLCSSVVICGLPADDECCGRKSFVSKISFIPKVRLIGCWEGIAYCILLWIPIIVLFSMLYIFVIKDNIKPDKATAAKPKTFLKRHTTGDFLDLLDLGV